MLKWLTTINILIRNKTASFLNSRAAAEQFLTNVSIISWILDDSTRGKKKWFTEKFLKSRISFIPFL